MGRLRAVLNYFFRISRISRAMRRTDPMCRPRASAISAAGRRRASHASRLCSAGAVLIRTPRILIQDTTELNPFCSVFPMRFPNTNAQFRQALALPIAPELGPFCVHLQQRIGIVDLTGTA